MRNESHLRVEYDPKALDAPMIYEASPWTAIPYNRSCIRHRSDSNCNCSSGKLYEKCLGTIEVKYEYVMRIRLDNGRVIYLNPHWGCGGNVSPRVVVGARIKVYQHDDKIFYRLVGR